MSRIQTQFHQDTERTTADVDRRAFVRKALRGYEVKRDETKATFTDWQRARTAAAAVKREGVGHLDRYLVEFEEKFTARGGKVFWASNWNQARDYILNLAKERGVKSIVKSKAMTSEEIHLNDALEKQGYEVVESDLGEFNTEAPYHFVFPCMHLTRDEIRALVQK